MWLIAGAAVLTLNAACSNKADEDTAAIRAIMEKQEAREQAAKEKQKRDVDAFRKAMEKPLPK
jgi:hypothetical protein